MYPAFNNAVIASVFTQVDALRKLVKECGVDSTGSKMDLLLRLREEMKTRSTYDKVFQKVWGASGNCPIQSWGKIKRPL